MKTITDLAREYEVSPQLVRKLHAQGRLVNGKDGTLAKAERHGNVWIFPDDTIVPRIRAAYGALTPEQRHPWKRGKK